MGREEANGEQIMVRVAPSLAAADVPDTIRLTSPAFADGEVLAMRYTCDGTNANPPLRWRDVPDGTVELVLVVEDRDVEGDGAFVHWMVADLHPMSPGIDEDEDPEGSTTGVNDFGDSTYAGPCPEHGAPAHAYVFTLMASREHLDLPPKFDSETLLSAIDGFVVARGELVARYGRTELGRGPDPPVHAG